MSSSIRTPMGHPGGHHPGLSQHNRVNSFGEDGQDGSLGESLGKWSIKLFLFVGQRELVQTSLKLEWKTVICFVFLPFSFFKLMSQWRLWCYEVIPKEDVDLMLVVIPAFSRLAHFHYSCTK